MIIFLRLLLLLSIINGFEQASTECYLTNIDKLLCVGINQAPVSDWSFEKQKKFNWDEIRELWLVKNKIKSFKNGIFTQFTNSEKIYIRGNELSVINFNEFGNNLNLTVLDVGQNRITEIKPIKASTNLNITKLWILDNDLIDISELCKIPKLIWLDLSRNRRLDFSKVMFNCWSELTELSLVDTNLKHLNHDYRVLAGCNKLKGLDLNDNDLDFLCFDKFPALLKLSTLNIRNNSLINLEVHALKRKFQNLSWIVLTGNRWSCDYYEKTLKIELQKSNIVEDALKGFENEFKCLHHKVTSVERNCPKTENVGSLFVSFWVFITLICVVFTTELGLLKYFKQIFD